MIVYNIIARLIDSKYEIEPDNKKQDYKGVARIFLLDRPTKLINGIYISTVH